MHPRHAARGVAALALSLALAPAALSAQAQPAAAGSESAGAVVLRTFVKDVEAVERKLVGLLEAIPEEAYAWRPAEGVRSIGEVAMHVAADNYFLPTLADVAAPGGSGIKAGDYASVQAYEARQATKAEALAELRTSFAHLRTSMQGTDEAFLARQISVFGQTMSGMDLWFLTATHLHEHLGQVIAYARANGVVPPWSRGD